MSSLQRLLGLLLDAASLCRPERRSQPLGPDVAPAPAVPEARPSLSTLKPDHPSPHCRKQLPPTPPTTPATLLLDALLRPPTQLPRTVVLTHTDYAASAKPPKRPLNGMASGHPLGQHSRPVAAAPKGWRWSIAMAQTAPNHNSWLPEHGSLSAFS